MKVEQGSITSLVYRVTAPGGRIVEQVLSDEPLTVVQGSGALSPEIERRIEGLTAGDSIAFELPERSNVSDENHRPIEVPLRRLPDGFMPRVGAAIGCGEAPNGRTLWVREVHGDRVVLDPRDPLDEVPLTVRIWILDVQKPVAAT